MEQEANVAPCCMYHGVLQKLYSELMIKISEKYDWVHFNLWLGDNSYFSNSFKEIVSLTLGVELTEQQCKILETKGLNLETKIHGWIQTYSQSHNEERLPLEYLDIKLHEYLLRHFQNKDIREIIGQPC